jgi:uncharacterized protein DUF1653
VVQSRGSQTDLRTHEALQEAERVTRGIYKANQGALYEVIASAASAEDFEQLVIYRELFGEFRFWVAPPSGDRAKPPTATRNGFHTGQAALNQKRHVNHARAFFNRSDSYISTGTFFLLAGKHGL